MLGGLLGRFADQPGQWDERGRGEHEQRNVSGMEGEVDDERDRGERERRPEELPRHPDTLTACRRQSSSTGDTLIRFAFTQMDVLNVVDRLAVA